MIKPKESYVIAGWDCDRDLCKYRIRTPDISCFDSMCSYCRKSKNTKIVLLVNIYPISSKKEAPLTPEGSQKIEILFSDMKYFNKCRDVFWRGVELSKSNSSIMSLMRAFPKHKKTLTVLQQQCKEDLEKLHETKLPIPKASIPWQWQFSVPY